MAGWLRRQCEWGVIALGDPHLAAEMLRGMMIMEPQRAVMLGQRAAPVVPLSAAYIVANYKETQLAISCVPACTYWPTRSVRLPTTVGGMPGATEKRAALDVWVAQVQAAIERPRRISNLQVRGRAIWPAICLRVATNDPSDRFLGMGD
jgi:hypothetical protein